MVSSCVGLQVALSSVSVVIGSVALIDCFLRDVSAVVTNLRVWLLATVFVGLIRDATQTVERTYLPGTLAYIGMDTGTVSTVYFTENFFAVLSSVQMAPKPTRIITILRYLGGGISLYTMAALFAFLANPTFGTDIARLLALGLIAIFIMMPSSFAVGNIGYVLRQHKIDMERKRGATASTSSTEMKGLRSVTQALRTCIIFSFAMGFFALFYLGVAVGVTMTQLQHASETWQHPECKLSGAYQNGLTHILYWFTFYLTRAPAAERRPSKGSVQTSSKLTHSSFQTQVETDATSTANTFDASTTTRSGRDGTSKASSGRLLNIQVRPIRTDSSDGEPIKFTPIDSDQIVRMSTDPTDDMVFNQAHSSPSIITVGNRGTPQSL